jgi:hypothetical protein
MQTVAATNATAELRRKMALKKERLSMEATSESRRKALSQMYTPG